MNRLSFLVLTLIVACASLADTSQVRAADRPNLIYILMDDAGYGDLSCYGQKLFPTPNIDRLAAEGLKFTDHYSGSTVCAPTRCCLMTGLHTGHALVRGNREVQPEGQAPLPADVVTLPRILSNAGYTTGMFGKWGLGAPGSTSDPADHFSEFFGYNCQRQAHTYYPSHLWRNREKVELDGKTYSEDLISDAALGFIRKNAQGPFFCFMPVTVPHAAMHIPEEDAAPFRKKFPQFEDTIGRYKGPEVRNPVAAFAGMMTRLDRHVGQVLDLLKELKIDGNTIVMLSSDNGPHLEGGHKPRFFDSNGPLKGFKRDLYEGGIRVPLLARWPGKIKAGTTTDHISAHWDMLPTLCDFAGAPVPEGIDGISFRSTLEGNVRGQKQHEYLYWEFHSQGAKQAVRMGEWKGVRLNVRKKPDGPVEVYHLPTDLGETNDVAKAHPEIARKLVEIMRDAHEESDTFPLFVKK